MPVSNIKSGMVPAPLVATPAPKSPLVTNDPNRVEFAKDSNGRSIGVRVIDALDMFELTLLFGEHSANAPALNQALMVASVVEIDGRSVHRPMTMLELKARIKELGFPGYTAAAEAIAKFAPDDGDENVAALKN